MFGKLTFYLRHSLNDLRVNRQRTLFALLCIGAGVAAIVSMQTLAVMMNNALTESLQESNRGDLRLIPNDNWQSYSIELPEGEGGLEGNHVFTEKGVAYIQDWLDTNFPGSEVTHRQARYGFGVGWTASIPARDTYKLFIYNLIVDPNQYPLYGSVKTKDGKRLSSLLQAPTDVVISQNLADELEAKVGDTMRISGASQDFTVRGIVPTDTEAGFQNFLAHMFGYFYLDRSATALFPDLTPGYASTLYIRLGDPSQVDVAKNRLERVARYVSITSTTDRSSVSGTNPAPMPCILCGPGLSGSPARFCVRTGLADGSTATEVMALPMVCLM